MSTRYVKLEGDFNPKAHSINRGKMTGLKYGIPLATAIWIVIIIIGATI